MAAAGCTLLIPSPARFAGLEYLYVLLATGKANLEERRQRRIDNRESDADRPTGQSGIAFEYLLTDVLGPGLLPGRLAFGRAALRQGRVG